MFRMYSKGCEYAIRALIELGLAPKGGFLTAREICQRAKLPEPFARKAFQLLSNKALLNTVTGPKGGYRLARSAHKISLRAIIEAADSDPGMDRCVMGLPFCQNESPCALHNWWVKTKESLIPQLNKMTLGELLVLEKKRRKA